MAEIAINQAVSPSFPIRVADHEILHPALVPTYDSLCYLREHNPDCEFVFVIGSDWLQPGTNIREWTSNEGCTGDRLLNEFDFLVLPRPGYEVGDLKAFGPRMYWLTLPEGFKWVESNATSTELRKRAKFTSLRELSVAGEHESNLRAMDGLLPPSVLAYIRRHRLHEDLASDFDLLSAHRAADVDIKAQGQSTGAHPALRQGI